MRFKSIRFYTLLTALFLLPSAAHAENLEWIRQLGTHHGDTSFGVSADSLGNVYITGSTLGDLGGTNAGEFTDDVFISKYDDRGTLAWTRQFGTSKNEISWGVSADGLGNVYITGSTGGDLGGTSAGGTDAFVAKFNSANVPEPSSDLTNNGFVDFEDLTVLLANWNKQVGAAAGNLVNPTTTPVNFEDLTVLLADWTGPAPAASPAAALGAEAVPEPSTLALALIAALVGMSAVRRRRDDAPRHSIVVAGREKPIAKGAERRIGDGSHLLQGHFATPAAKLGFA